VCEALHERSDVIRPVPQRSQHKPGSKGPNWIDPVSGQRARARFPPAERTLPGSGHSPLKMFNVDRFITQELGFFAAAAFLNCVAQVAENLLRSRLLLMQPCKSEP
jgi:hypothetical protein